MLCSILILFDPFIRKSIQKTEILIEGVGIEPCWERMCEEGAMFLAPDRSIMSLLL